MIMIVITMVTMITMMTMVAIITMIIIITMITTINEKLRRGQPHGYNVYQPSGLPARLFQYYLTKYYHT